MNTDLNNYYGNITRMIKYFKINHPNHLANGMLEIKLDILDDSLGIKPRYAYSFDVDDNLCNEIKSDIENLNFDADGYKITFDYKLNPEDFIDKYKENKKISIESNWRGRLFKASEFQMAKDKKKFLMKSYWRIIVVKDAESNFYTRHDIYPMFWSPGFSVAGQKNFEESIINILNHLSRQKPFSLDTQNDFLKVFAMNQVTSKQLTSMQIYEHAGLFGDELQISEEFDFNLYQDLIIRKLNEYFSQ